MFTQQNSNLEAPVRAPLRNVFSNVFLGLVFLLPLAFFPGVMTLTFVAKMSTIAVLLGVSIIIYLLNVLGTGIVEFPKSFVTWSLLTLPVVAILSSFFSTSLMGSLIGDTFEVGTAGFFVIMYVLFVVAMLGGSKEKIQKRAAVVYLFSMGISLIYSLFLALLQSFEVSFVAKLPFSLVGTYIDQAILLGGAILIASYFLSFTDISKLFKSLLWVFLAFALVFIGAVGFLPLNLTLAVFSLLMFVYLISIFRNQESSWIKKSYPTLVSLVFFVLFILAGTPLSAYLSGIVKINSFDVRPNLTTTLNIVKAEWAHNAITGSGPNRFAELWSSFKNPEINKTDFWGSDFFFGSGLLPTLFATMGLLGVLSLLTFGFFFIKKGFSSFFAPVLSSPGEDTKKRIVSIYLFLTALFFWVSMVVYDPGVVVVSFAFIFTGLFVASLASLSLSDMVKVNIFSNPKTNFVSVFLVVVLVVLTVSTEYFILEKMAASVIYNKAALEFNNTRDINAAKVAIARAAAIYGTDTYNRSLAELSLLNVESISASIPTNASNISEEVRNNLQTSVGSAIEYARAAILRDGYNYQNHMTMGRIYESLATKGIQGANESAKQAYGEAQKLNPLNPQISLSFARLSVLSGNAEEAKIYVNKAIEQKNNYTDAYFMLAQLEAATNNIPGTIKAVESATLLDPNNTGLYFQLGLIKYQVGDNTGAATALERAITLAPDYANAKYFLGLAYYNLGRKDEALIQFQDIQKTNPDNQEVKFILDNLNAGKAPFANVKPPLDNKPEKRDTPPVKEN